VLDNSNDALALSEILIHLDPWLSEFPKLDLFSKVVLAKSTHDSANHAKKKRDKELKDECFLKAEGLGIFIE